MMSGTCGRLVCGRPVVPTVLKLPDSRCKFVRMKARPDVMPRVFFGIVAGLALLIAQAATAQDSLAQRLSSDRPGQISCGAWLAGDRIGFTLDAAAADYLLRFDGSPEVFVLHPDKAALGGKVLRYDSGETALQVSGWGGLTLYTDANPSGVPAVRTGDAAIQEPAPPSLAELVAASEDDSENLGRDRGLDLVFTADWNGLAGNGPARALALDTMENVARGIERFGRTAHGREELARRVKSVMLAVAGRPTVTLNGRTLTVTFDPGQGYEGRASSRAITRALATLFAGPQKQS